MSTNPTAFDRDARSPAARCRAEGHDPALATGVCLRCGVDLLGYYDDLSPEFRLAITQGLMDEGMLR